MRRTHRGLLSLLALLFSTAVLQPVIAQELEDRVVEHTLDNGMKLLLLRRPQSPTVAFAMYFNVGGVDEPAGKTGIAHMLEHMLFKGTTTIGTTNYEAEVPLMEKIDALYEEYDAERDKGEAADSAKLDELRAAIKAAQDEQRQYILNNQFDEIYSYHGAEGLNAGTSIDYTVYVISLPSNKVELWARMESERMRDAVMREFYVERDVVMEERRMRTETNPDGLLSEAFHAAAFIAHPYRDPIIGWPSDIDRLKRRDAEAFFRTYYSPNNAVVAIVGDIDPNAMIALMEKYFGDIPPQEIPDRISTKEPKQQGERRVIVEFDAEPRLLIGYHKPTVPAFDDFVFDVISGLLSSGRTSRLYKALVETQIAVSVDTYNGSPGARYDNLFVIEAVPRYPNTTEDVEKAIYAELERLKTDPIEERELQKVRNQIQANFVRGLDSNTGMAHQLGYFELVAGTWKYVLTLIDTVNRITAEDVQRVAGAYFIPSNRTVATLVKKSELDLEAASDANASE